MIRQITDIMKPPLYGRLYYFEIIYATPQKSLRLLNIDYFNSIIKPEIQNKSEEIGIVPTVFNGISDVMLVMPEKRV